MDTNNFLVGDEDFFFAVQLELVVDRLGLELFDLILVQDATLHFLKVPSDKEIASRGDDGGFLSVGAKVVYLCRLEIDASNSVLGDIGGPQLQLERIGLLFAHAVLKASLAIGAHRGHAEQVRLRGCQHPQTITTDLHGLDWVTQAWKQSFRILPYLLVQADFAIIATKSKTASHGSTHRAEHRVGLVRSFSCDAAL